VQVTATTLATTITTTRARVPRPEGPAAGRILRSAATPERAREGFECRTRAVDTIALSFWHQGHAAADGQPDPSCRHDPAQHGAGFAAAKPQEDTPAGCC
jgi:hypothetical protein